MKARIKSTGDIFPIAPYAKVTLNVCDDRGTPYEVDFEDIELIQDNISESDTKWQAFRREAAKDLLPLATQMKDYRGSPEECVSLAIQLADELIKQLKEK